MPISSLLQPSQPMEKLLPADGRVEYRTTVLHGNSYYYLLGSPDGRAVGTMLLLHGFPDLGYGWRYQVPYLMARNWRVVVPDMLGYGRTDSPADVNAYRLQSMAADMAALVEELCGPGGRVVLGGHDWGAALAWRMARWHPDRVDAVFGICTPYLGAAARWIDPDQLYPVMPTLGYQRQFGGGELARQVDSPARMRRFLAAMFARADQPAGFDPVSGIAVACLDTDVPGLLSLTSDELDVYAAEYARTGLVGPLHWYHTRRLNYDDELGWAHERPPEFAMPALFISARDDPVLRPGLSGGMGVFFDQLTRREVNAGHWAHWEQSMEVNGLIGEWLDSDVMRDTGSEF